MKKAADGKTYKEHLLAAYDQTGRMPDKLANLPVLPPHLEGVWLRFCDINNRIAGEKITWTDIHSYCVVNNTTIPQWELTAIFTLEAALIEAITEK